MNESMKEMAKTMMTTIGVARLFINEYKNRRDCPAYSELKGMELALDVMGIKYEYEFDFSRSTDDLFCITAVTVMGNRVAE